MSDIDKKGSKKSEEKTDIKQEIIDFFKDLIIIVLIVLFIRTFLVEPFQISGQSMYASYYDKEFIIVDRFSYLDIPLVKTGEIHRGDVIVFKPGVSKDKEFFIKRVIGLGGDSIRIEDGKVFLKKAGGIDFIELDESEYLIEENNGHTSVKGGEKDFLVPKGKYFVMGDNRNHSSDSRTCFSYSCSVSSKTSYISKDSITGKVLIDLGYFNFKTFSFTHSYLGIDTSPKWLSSHSTHDYK